MTSTNTDNGMGETTRSGFPPKFTLLKYLSAFLLSALIFACSYLAPQERRGTAQTPPVPECERNLLKETTLPSGILYKTWVKYDNLDYNRAFDAAVFSIQSNGYSVRTKDRMLGTIHGEMTSGQGQQTLRPVDVDISRGNTSLTVNLRLMGTEGDKDRARSCSFYADFEKKIKEGTTASSPNEPPKPALKPAQPSTVKTQDAAKPATPTVETKQKPGILPSPSSPSSTPLRVTEVAWETVNLREGPGMNHKVIGSAKKGTRLQVFEDKGGWLRACLEDGKEVWVSKSATPEAPKTPSPPASSSSTNPSPSSSKRAPSKPVSPM
ncbi:MAG: Bacterial domain [Deltaproteobacteria bacterium]|nr:Bacterial domain [Deltaproteobacteria bacterium]